MWKHKTKWLVRGGRKVKCYLCGKKVLSKDLFLFHADTGYYSHQSCMTESTTISGNERRRAVKKIAVGAAIVGAIAAGAGKLIDISSQSKGSNSPDTQTILTSQGLILPALTSDPANPVAGQMWDRSDAGVMAHFDAVQNRVVYSSEINDGNVNVTPKGIVNGLSVLPNDGKGGFGPDTTEGATAPGQYGGTYTETSGLQEAGNYAFSQYQVLTAPGSTIAVPAIKILDGYYVLSSPVTFDPSSYIPSGTSLNAWVIDYSPNAIVYYNGTGYAITISGNSSTEDMALFVHGSNGFLGSNATGMYYWVFPSTLIPNNSYAVFHDANNSTSTSSQYYIYFIGQLSLEVQNSAAGGIIHANETVGFYADIIMPGEGQEGIFEVCARYVYIKGAQSVQFVSETNLVNPEVMILEECTGTIQPVSRQVKIVGGYELTVALTSSNIFKINTLDIEDTSGPTSGAFISLATPVGTLRCRNIIAKYASATFIDVQTDGSVANYDVEQGINVPDSYTFASIPVNTPTTPSVPTSATAQENTNPYAVDVYVYGGDVTEIQITRNGTAYTVFSVSTAIAMSGQSYKLDPGDSITVTYSTAPTWEWLSD